MKLWAPANWMRLPWLNLLITYDIVFTAVAFMVFDYVVEE